MNVNSKLMQVGKSVGYPIAPDLYTGSESKYLVFTYADERGAMYADNDENYTVATIQVSFYCPASYNYMNDKAKIKKALKENDFEIESFESWLDNESYDTERGTERIRHSVFTCKITQLTEE